jgi:hypothetical protein
MYSANCLEWHLGDELSNNPAGFCVVLSYSMTSLLTQFNRLVVAFAKSRDHRASCGVFSFLHRPYSTRKQCIYMDGLEQNIGLCNHPTDNPRELCARYHTRLVDKVRQDTNRLNRILMGKLVTVGNGLKGECYSPLGKLLSKGNHE